jgi:hypothetical protein
MGSEVLSKKRSGFMIFIYLVTSVVTLILASGSLGLEMRVYNLNCKTDVIGSCSSWTYTLPFVLPHELSLVIVKLTGCQGYCDDVLHHYACIGCRSSSPIRYSSDHWH